MEERTRYVRGAKVEVLKMNDPPFGSWHCGEIVSGDGHFYMVRYYSMNSATMIDTLERVSYKFIRPYPPLLDISRNWTPGELVEVFDNFSWRMGNVSEALGRNYFLVRLLGFCQVLIVSSSDIRARRSWQDDRWTLIGPGSSTLDGTNSIRLREIIDVESYDFSGETRRPSFRQDLKRSLVIVVPRYPERGSLYTDSRSESNVDDCQSIQSSTSSCSINSHSSVAESSCYENRWQGNEDLDVEVRRLELHAYHRMMEALSTSGTLTWEQESLVTNLRMLLHISNDEHLLKLRQLVRIDRSMRVS